MCLAIASCASAAVPTYRYQNQGVYHPQPIHPQPIHHPVPHYVAGNEATAPVVRAVSEISPDNSQYNYEYETGNGIVAKEAGLAAKSVEGSYSYTAPDGTPVQVSYVADENGFQPTGAHLPVAPETPAHVLRLVEYLRVHGQKEDGQVRYTPVAPIVPTFAKAYYTPTAKPFAFKPFARKF